MKEPTIRFDEESHTYWLKDRTVPSVTTVMGEILGQPYQATEWHMRRGTAVHAYAALVGQGVAFEEPDERIRGQVEACRKFHAVVGGEILEVEKVYASVRYQFAGTSDLIIRLNNKETFLVDWKATLTKQTEIQLGGYSILSGVRKGVGVQLNADGTFKMSPIYDLKRPAQEFLSLLSAYNTKARLGMLSKDGPHVFIDPDTGEETIAMW